MKHINYAIKIHSPKQLEDVISCLSFQGYNVEHYQTLDYEGCFMDGIRIVCFTLDGTVRLEHNTDQEYTQIEMSALYMGWTKIKNIKEKVMESPSINVKLPETLKEKVAAIQNLSGAIYELAKALNSIHADVSISNCHIQSSGAGIKIGESNEDTQ